MHVNKKETWLHPSNFSEDYDCSACKDGDDDKERVDPCLNGCHFECVPGCPYIPEYGLETFDHIIEYRRTGLRQKACRMAS